MADNSCDFLSIMVALTALLFGAMNLGQVAALMPDAADASMAASKIFTLIERQSAIDPLSADGERVVMIFKHQLLSTKKFFFLFCFSG